MTVIQPVHTPTSVAIPGHYFLYFPKFFDYWMATYMGVAVRSCCYKLAPKCANLYSHTHHGECLGEKLLNQIGYLRNTRKRLSQDG